MDSTTLTVPSHDGNSADQQLEPLNQLSFEYGDIPPADKKALEKHADNVLAIQERQRRFTAESVLKLGKELAAAQERLSNHGNGTFGKWCSERCGISARTAYNAIGAASCFSEQDRAKLAQSFDASALYVLSADTCPEQALADAIEAAKSGEVITHKRAKEIIAEYTVDDGDHHNQHANVETSNDASTSAACPRGGAHEWQTDDDGTACAKCLEPGPEPEQAKSPASDVAILQQRLTELQQRQATHLELLPAVWAALDSTTGWHGATGRGSRAIRGLHSDAIQTLEVLFQQATGMAKGSDVWGDVLGDSAKDAAREAIEQFARAIDRIERGTR